MQIFKNKIFLMLIATLFAICLFNSKCFATVDIPVHDDSFGDITLRLSDVQSSYSNYSIIHVPAYDSQGGFYVFLTNGNFAFNKNWNGYHFSTEPLIIFRSNCLNNIVDFESQDVYESYNVFESSNTNGFGYGSSSSVFRSDSSFLYSSSDIYLFDSKTEELNTILFQGASQPMEETPQVVLAEIVEHQETNKVMEEILGILPIVIVVIVSLIAIRKAIAFLRTLLHRS